jgi:hypothetical protein
MPSPKALLDAMMENITVEGYGRRTGFKAESHLAFRFLASQTAKAEQTTAEADM